MKKGLSIILVAIVFAACQGRRSGNDPVRISDTIPFSTHVPGTIGSVVDSVTYLALETNEKSIFSYVDKMIIRGGKMYLGDYGGSRLVVFDTEGNHLLTIDKRGRGPGEYLILSAFTVDDHWIYLMDNDSGTLRKFDLSGNFVEEYTLPVLAWDMAAFDNGDLMFATAPLVPQGFVSGQTRHRIFITDRKLKIHTSLFEYERDQVDPIGKRNYLFETDDRIVFHTVGSDLLTLFSKADPRDIEHLSIDFGSNKIPEKYRSDIHEIDEGRYNYIYSTPAQAGRYLALEVNLGEFFETFLFDRNSGRLLMQKDNDPIIFPYPNGSFNGNFYMIMNGITQYRALIDGGFPKAASAVVDHLEQEGTVIMIYHMNDARNQAAT